MEENMNQVRYKEMEENMNQERIKGTISPDLICLEMVWSNRPR
jgi:hypothetical protein